ncbi:MAG: phosphate ABC transporter substrate-binding protein [Candidatus Brocadiales bacterium]|nr:phosphate ABC transporter substrate-binding protein [Candidatus Bathyanammoxibius amoris]
MVILLRNIVAALLFTSCCYGEPGSSGGTISISGSTTCLPVVSRAAEEFMQKHPQVTITVSPGGSGVGVSALAKGAVDIGMTSRDISEKEQREYREVDFFLTPFARDAVVPVVSSEVYEAGITHLSVSQIGDIYSGQLKNWKDLGGPDRGILVVDKESDRGTRHVFMQAIFGDKYAAPGATIVTGPNDDMQMAVATSGAAIGFLSHAWINANVRGLGIKVGEEVIYPTTADVRGGHFPISRNLSFVTDGPPKGMAKEFMDFVLSPKGFRIIVGANLVPLE